MKAFKKENLSLAASALIVVLTAIGACVMLTNSREGLLIVHGVRNFRYFTVDSNILLGLVHLALLITACVRRGRTPLVLECLVYVATVATSLTFAIVVGFFGPSIGYGELFRDANLYFHGIVPVLGIVVLCVFHRRRIPMRETLIAVIPSAVYGLYYTLVLLTRGVRFPDTDWYGFAQNGLGGSVVSAAGVFLVTWVLALLLRLAAGSAGKRK